MPFALALALSAATLDAIVAETGHGVYGVAAPAGTRPEVTRGSDGEVWVRYLGSGAKLGEAPIRCRHPRRGVVESLI